MEHIKLPFIEKLINGVKDACVAKNMEDKSKVSILNANDCDNSHLRMIANVEEQLTKVLQWKDAFVESYEKSLENVKDAA